MTNPTYTGTGYDIADLVETLRDAAENILNATDPAEMKAWAEDQLAEIERFQAAEAQADADALTYLWAMSKQAGISREEFDRAFPPETGGRLVPPFVHAVTTPAVA